MLIEHVETGRITRHVANAKGRWHALGKRSDGTYRAMEMTQLLLDKGADPFALDDRGKQPGSSDPAIQGLLDSARKRIELKALAENLHTRSPQEAR